jgi:hypothetical protein
MLVRRIVGIVLERAVRRVATRDFLGLRPLLAAVVRGGEPDGGFVVGPLLGPEAREGDVDVPVMGARSVVVDGDPFLVEEVCCAATSELFPFAISLSDQEIIGLPFAGNLVYATCDHLERARRGCQATTGRSADPRARRGTNLIVR